MFGIFGKKPAKAAGAHPPLPLYLQNTLSGQKERFEQPEGKPVKMYNCGPTVYGPAHVGNLRSYIFADTLRRTFEYNNFAVKQVINITDVGHLTSDADSGEDKMSKGLRREGLDLTLENMKILAERYAEKFLQDLAAINVETEGTQFPRASEHIEAQIAMVQTLEEKGYAYKTSDGVYFDTARFPTYGKLGNIDIEALKEGARVEVNPEKKNPTDFNLWKLNPALGWESPWGKGFPGWHIECSAMIRCTLGEQIDIHTGGIDHIPVHHNNEIAQSEAATGKPLARFWMHNAFITIDSQKISKSLSNEIYLDTLPGHGIHPLALRYFYLGARYNSPVNFSWDALKAAQQALLRLVLAVEQAPEGGVVNAKYQKRFQERINDDLDTPGALAIAWELAKDDSLNPADIRATLLDFDTALGLNLAKPDRSLQALKRAAFGEATDFELLSDSVKQLVNAREEARKAKDYEKADQLRAQLASLGYEVEDSPTGARILRKE